MKKYIAPCISLICDSVVAFGEYDINNRIAFSFLAGIMATIIIIYIVMDIRK